MIDLEPYCVTPGSPADLLKIPSDDDGGTTRGKAKATFKRLIKRLDELQELLYADGSRALLVIFQAMDAGGKDSTIREVFSPLDAQGVHVAGFKAPSNEELAHDFLWRVHPRCPPLGHIAIFNRSHYEDVGIVRVKKLVPPARWRRRYQHINSFEKMLHDEGTVILKFFLHISSEYQKQRLERRLKRPDKHWKFNPDDLAERARWDEYMQAYSEMISRCSKPWAPWYVIPAEQRWYRDLLVAAAVVEALEKLDLKYPSPRFDPGKITVP